MIQIPESTRKQMMVEAQGKVVKALEYTTEKDSEGCGAYWTLTFTDGSEMSFRFMAELV